MKYKNVPTTARFTMANDPLPGRQWKRLLDGRAFWRNENDYTDRVFLEVDPESEVTIVE